MTGREMTNFNRILLNAALFLVPGIAAGQMLDPSLLMKPLSDSWPTYSGDYSGKRYSALKQINQTNVKGLTLAWTSRVAQGSGGGGGRGGGAHRHHRRRRCRFRRPTVGGANIRASILQVERHPLPLRA